MNNRPRIRSLQHIALPAHDKQILANGIPLYSINAGTEEVLRIDLIFEAGVWNQPSPLVAFYANQMLREGTKMLSSTQIAEQLDFYGAWLQLSNGYHHSFISLYSLNKHLEPTLSVLEDMVKNPSFPENEFHTIVNAGKQRYIVDSQKVNVLASRRFQTMLYGEQHPYGRTAKLDDYDALNVLQLKDFHRQFYHSANCKIVISGHVDDKVVQSVAQRFGDASWGVTATQFITPDFRIHTDNNYAQFIEKRDAVQSAVVMGRPVETCTHPNFHNLQVLNTVFGGYFGSRLMSSIREKKGYTYGISSAIACRQKAAQLVVASQTAVPQALVKEVYNEMDKLCTKPISQRELSIVKSYLLGETLRNFDGAFAQADAITWLITHDIDLSFYEQNIQNIRNITPQTIQQTAQRYLQEKDFYQVICGSNE